MLSSSPTSCTSPSPDGENPSKKVQWTSGRRRTSSTDSESKSHPDFSKVPRSRRPSRLTVKYDRGQLQRWLEMELWVDAQIQELFQGQPTPPEPEIDLEALMELSTEEQKTHLEVECGPGVGEWKLSLEREEPRNSGFASLSGMGRTSSEERIPGKLSGGLWESSVAQGLTLCSFPPGSSPKLPPPHRVFYL
ncbi:protein phosphatase 1 regulatory subunit 14D isoform X1 [Prionailurus viverrinus]|uniref:Protein phosphatase 1 regulatory subunit 14 n=1 Tax=Lynx canadensis TaxID=61383 RepID=A0A667G210_LYNCA|nr:protein phosphatase 1 regulatory subunit 14D isoform X1 [Felis catus]XP_047718762.1 protein phosphatase 1 regulatory subunit 14D isoform X1 [Prionailurus viverrinus]XP_047718763.1 protein phosphatase 1 regulatory subunit 14D isoform X1 [Prionailurus viverrinus]XP_047718764.1 protein phosphatase 1 regulatory subunit 14D isoform X1 [Prionailurus viverrinus]XP_047718765.1 protein phosphatase 1 regulatory subunit 14D isoform X1 [Prionailurus viverrinus]